MARTSVSPLAHLHGQVSDIGGLRHAGHAENAAVSIVVQAGRLGIGAEGVLLHHPEVGAAVHLHHLRIVNHAAIDAGHGQRDADEQTETEAGECELAPRMQDVPSGQVDHLPAPASDSTTLRRLSAVISFSL